MRLTFYGAAGEVTGSCYLLETSRARILIDFGLHQGSRAADERNRRPPPLDVRHLDAVILTHAHLDHSGRLPLLVAAEYAGPIYTTPASTALAEILLRDAVNLQAADNERLNTRRRRSGLEPLPPLYESNDVEAALKLFRPLPYWESREVARGITARLVDAGHILGSASLELTVHHGDDPPRTLVFSGDIGPTDFPLVRNPTALKHADVLVLEATYGNRNHRPREATLEEFKAIVREAAASGGKILIPSFAIGRAQDLIYIMSAMHRSGEWKELGDLPVILDSPMAIDATDLYLRHRELLDGETQKIFAEGENPLRFPNLRLAASVDESRAINHLEGAAVIIAGSGMCNGGRIVHHLRHQLWREEAHLVIVGYQAAGTLGRRIVDGARRVRILGEPVAVKARVHTLGGFSAHAGRDELLAWARNFSPAPRRLFLTHAEPAARDAFAELLKTELGLEAERPEWGDAAEL